MKRVLALLVFVIVPLMLFAEQTPGPDHVMDYKDLEKEISGITVQTASGEEVELESLWKDRRIVLTFLRHFG